MCNKQIILASASPRRKELLEKAGLNFKVQHPDPVEEILPGEEPHSLAQRISLRKARGVATVHSHCIVVSADTFIFLDGDILGKPASADAARNMLRRLSGRSHRVITGYSIIDVDSQRTLSASEETVVFMKNMTEKEIDDYVSTGEPLDKAGAYAIQGLGAGLVEHIEGDYENVVGLPLTALKTALSGFGVYID
jgi:septum formation protein